MHSDEIKLRNPNRDTNRSPQKTIRLLVRFEMSDVEKKKKGPKINLIQFLSFGVYNFFHKPNYGSQRSISLSNTKHLPDYVWWRT